MMIFFGHLPEASHAPSLLLSDNSEYLSVLTLPNGAISTWR